MGGAARAGAGNLQSLRCITLHLLGLISCHFRLKIPSSGEGGANCTTFDSRGRDCWRGKRALNLFVSAATTPEMIGPGDT